MLPVAPRRRWFLALLARLLCLFCSGTVWVHGALLVPWLQWRVVCFVARCGPGHFSLLGGFPSLAFWAVLAGRFVVLRSLPAVMCVFRWRPVVVLVLLVRFFSAGRLVLPWLCSCLSSLSLYLLSFSCPGLPVLSGFCVCPLPDCLRCF